DPSRLKVAEFTLPSWPRRTAICWPLAASQMRAVLSCANHDSCAVTMREPSWLKAAEFTLNLRPTPRPRRHLACDTAAASTAAAGEALVLSTDDAKSMRVPRDASLSALSKSLSDSLVVESSAKMLARACSSCCLLSVRATSLSLSRSSCFASCRALSHCKYPTVAPAISMTAPTAATAQREIRCRRAARADDSKI